MPENENNPSPKKKKRGFLWVIIVILIVVLAATMGGYALSYYDALPACSMSPWAIRLRI